MKKIVILGAGTGGTIMANKLVKKLDFYKWSITIIDKSMEHYYQPGLLFLPFRHYRYDTRSDIVKPIEKPLPKKVRFVNAEIKLIDHKNRWVETNNGKYDYDWLIIALGVGLAPDEIEGLAESFGPHGNHFYHVDAALELQKSLEDFNEGRFVLNVTDMPVKCPVAPIEFMFLADYYFHRRGIRDRVELEFVTPLSGAFTKPLAAKMLAEVAVNKNIKVTSHYDLASVDPVNRTLNSHSGKKISYDLLVSVPPHYGPKVIDESGLGDGIGFVITDKHTLKASRADRIFTLGDCTNVPTSKAGSVAHFEADIIMENLLREIDGKESLPLFDGHSNCFVESGFHKALLFDFNYEIEPLPGMFPFPFIGPFSLMKESYINHLGKLGFDWTYWNLLLKDRLPGSPFIPTNMSLRGKKVSLLKKNDKK